MAFLSPVGSLTTPLHEILSIPVDNAQDPSESLNRVIKKYGIHPLHSAPQQVVFNEMLDAIRLQQSANPLAASHEHITPFLAVGVHDILAPRYKSENILSYVRRRPLAPRLTWMTQVAMALAHLHDHGVVHGLVFAGNIVIEGNGQAAVTNTAAFTEACSHIPFIPIQESFTYQAPEFVKIDGSGGPTEATDVYAFGSTLYAVLTGVAPFGWRRFSFATLSEIGKYGHSRIPQPAVIVDDRWHLIQRCWNFDPSARPTMANIVTAMSLLQA